MKGEPVCRCLFSYSLTHLFARCYEFLMARVIGGWKLQLPAMSKQGEECGNEPPRQSETNIQTDGEEKEGREE